MMEDMEISEVNMMDFPNEILLKIFCNLNDFSLLRASHVCQRFKIIAKEAFAKNYNGTTDEKYFALNISNDSLMEDRKQYEPFFLNFGEDIGAMHINFNLMIGNGEVPRNHWLIHSIQRCCKSITKLIIENGEEIDLANIIYFMSELRNLYLEDLSLRNDKWTEYSYPNLTEFSATDVNGISRNSFVDFIGRNRQLEDISLIRCVEGASNIIYHLNETKIKSLVLEDHEGDFSSNSAIVKLDSLKELEIVTNENSIARFLTTIRDGCKNIEMLVISNSDDDDDDNTFALQHINLLRAFDTLEMLDLKGFVLPMKELTALVRSLPKLFSLAVSNADVLCKKEDDLLNVASTCRKLLFVTLNTDFILPDLTYAFYQKFANFIKYGSKLQLELICKPYKLIVTRDETRIVQELGKLNRIIFWKGYEAALSTTDKNLLELGDKNLQKITSYLNVNALAAFSKSCKLAECLVQRHLSQHQLYVSASPMNLTYATSIEYLGEHISRMTFEEDYESLDDDVTDLNRRKLLQAITKYCSQSLINVELKDRIISDTVLSWPNLQILKLSGRYLNVNNQTLGLFHCSKLTYLKIDYYGENFINLSVDWKDSFRSITSLEFKFYNEHVERFLYGINQEVAAQLKYLCLIRATDWFLENECRCWINLNYVISRFRRLEELHLYLKGIELSNYRFLFQSCTMLVKLSILCTAMEEEKLLEMFRLIKENCVAIKVICLVGEYTYFEASFLQSLYSMLPNVKINLVDVKAIGKCLCRLSKNDS